MNKDTIRNAALKIGQYLYVTKTASVESLRSIFSAFAPDDFYGAIGWLLREETATLDSGNLVLCTEPGFVSPFYF